MTDWCVAREREREREREKGGGWEGSCLDEEQAGRQAAASSLLWRAAERTCRLEPCRALTPRRRAQRHRLSRTGRCRDSDSLRYRRSTACCNGTMAQAAKQIRKNKDLQELAAQELREKEEEKIKKRNRSRDRRRKVTENKQTSLLFFPFGEGDTHLHTYH